MVGSDIVVVEKEEHKCTVIHVFLPRDNGDGDKCRELKRKVKNLRSRETSVVPVAVGALGVTSKKPQTMYSAHRCKKSYEISCTKEVLQRSPVILEDRSGGISINNDDDCMPSIRLDFVDKYS